MLLSGYKNYMIGYKENEIIKINQIKKIYGLRTA